MKSVARYITSIEKSITKSSLVKKLSSRTKKMRLPGFQGESLFDVSRFFISQVRKVALNDRARSIAFSFLTAIPAATIFICTLIPLLPIARKIERQLDLLTKDITSARMSFSVRLSPRASPSSRTMSSTISSRLRVGSGAVEMACSMLRPCCIGQLEASRTR